MEKKPGTHKMVEAMEGHQPEGIPQAGGSNPTESPRPGSTPQEIAEETRRKQEAQSHRRPDRDDVLTNIGRGFQTHG